MKTLGIFGDSFADPNHGHDDYPEDRQYGWPYLLSDSYDVEIFARGGTSLYYSYKLFLEHHHRFSKVIFTVSEPGRLCENRIKSTLGEDEFVFIPSWQQANYWLENDIKHIDKNEINKLKAMRDFYLHVDYYESSKLFSELLVERIRDIRPDVLLINSFYDQINGVAQPTVKNISGPALLQYLDLTVSGLIEIDNARTHGYVGNMKEIRCICHLSREVNKLLADNIRTSLETNVWDPVIPIRLEHAEKLTFYYDSTKRWW